MGSPRCYSIPYLSVPKNCYCLFGSLQPENGTGTAVGVLLWSLSKCEAGSRESSLSWQYLLKALLWNGLLWAGGSSHSEKLHYTIKNCFRVNFAKSLSSAKLELVPGAGHTHVCACVRFLPRHSPRMEDNIINTGGVQWVAAGSNGQQSRLHTCRKFPSATRTAS